MSNENSVPTFTPKNYKDTFQVDLFHLVFLLLYPLVLLQKRTVTSQFAEYVSLSFLPLFPALSSVPSKSM
jgi:hypothetical protein